LDEALEIAINMSLAVGAPLLVTGEPGTGKTQLAYFLGYYFGIQVRPFYVKSTATARDLKYEFDAVSYLQSAYMVQQGAAPLPRSRFLGKGPLWKAYEDPQPSVLLIDEIDKAPRDFPNDLLHELDQGWFHHPFERDSSGEPLRVPSQPGGRPILIITSNLERRLPDAFLRRCVFHQIELTQTVVRRAVAARAREFPNLAEELRRRAVDRFWELRDHGPQKPPSTAELLVWLAVLDALKVTQTDLDRPLAELPALGCLIKDRDDMERLRNL
jgi:MoxR-like ATPase